MRSLSHTHSSVVALQVKIRGNRIEMGEIEAALLTCPEILECCVVCKMRNSEKALVAYYVLKPSEDKKHTAPAESKHSDHQGSQEDHKDDLEPVQVLDASAARLTAKDLRAKIKETLPDYMIPSAILLLNRLPLNPNAKVDRAALPMPDVSELTGTYVAPRNQMEATLAQTCADVLGLERVGMQVGVGCCIVAWMFPSTYRYIS